MNNLENNNYENMTIYEKLTILIPKVKMIENIESKKILTFKIKEVMDKINELKQEYENLSPNLESIFFQKKENVEKIICIIIEEIETTLSLYETEDKIKSK